MRTVYTNAKHGAWRSSLLKVKAQSDRPESRAVLSLIDSLLALRQSDGFLDLREIMSHYVVKDHPDYELVSNQDSRVQARLQKDRKIKIQGRRAGSNDTWRFYELFTLEIKKTVFPRLETINSLLEEGGKIVPDHGEFEWRFMSESWPNTIEQAIGGALECQDL